MESPSTCINSHIELQKIEVEHTLTYRTDIISKNYQCCEQSCVIEVGSRKISNHIMSDYNKRETASNEKCSF